MTQEYVKIATSVKVFINDRRLYTLTQIWKEQDIAALRLAEFGSFSDYLKLVTHDVVLTAIFVSFTSVLTDKREAPKNFHAKFFNHISSSMCSYSQHDVARKTAKRKKLEVFIRRYLTNLYHVHLQKLYKCSLKRSVLMSRHILRHFLPIGY